MKCKLIVSLILIFLLFGCTSTKNASFTNTDLQPSYIGNFRTNNYDNYVRVMFSLYDSQENFIGADGTAQIKIVTDKGVEIYNQSHNVYKSGFSNFTNNLTGIKFNAFSINIQKSDMKKSNTSTGILYLKFKTNADTSFNELDDDTIYDLPKYSEDELENESNLGYQNNKTDTSIEYISSDGLKIKLKSYGAFSYYEYSETKTKLRVDLYIENTGSDKIYIRNSDSTVITSDGKEYFIVGGGSLDYGIDINPGVQKEGYILFDISPSNETFSKIIIGKDYIFDLQNLMAYTPEELAERKYDLNKIKINETKQMTNYISVELESIGLMNLNNKQYIRADLIVKNIGNEKINYYNPWPVILGKTANQIDDSYVSGYDEEFDAGDIYPGVIKKGAIFFEIQPDTKLDLKELIIETGLANYSLSTRDVGVGQALLYNKEYVFKFDLSNINIQID